MNIIVHYLSQYKQIICEVSCGAAHVVALSEDGLLQAWGKLLFWFYYFYLHIYLCCKYCIDYNSI